MTIRPSLAALLGAVFLALAAFSAGAVENAGPAKILREQDAGTTVDVSIGDVAEVRLAENPTTGYRWAMKPLDEKRCVLVRDEFIPPAGTALGAGGERRWQLRALASGNCDFEVVYSRSSGGEPRVYRVRLRIS